MRAVLAKGERLLRRRFLDSPIPPTYHGAGCTADLPWSRLYRRLTMEPVVPPTYHGAGCTADLPWGRLYRRLTMEPVVPSTYHGVGCTANLPWSRLYRQLTMEPVVLPTYHGASLDSGGFPVMFPAQVFPETAVADSSGRLTIGGCDVSDLVGEYGTPLYVFDEAMIRNRCREFLHEFRSRYPNTDVAYACKAYINPALARIFMEEGLGLDVVSGGEMALARSVGFPAASVCFHGNNKGRQELQDAVDWSIGTVALDSFHEIQLLDEIAGAAGVVQEVLVRVSPGIDAHTHVFTTTGILDSKFGFPIQTGQAEDAIHRVLRSSNLKLKGLHFHLGSPIFELEPYRKALELVLNFASKFREEGLDLREISPGGGFAIAYTKEQIPPTIAQYAEAIAGSLSDTCRSLGMDLPQLVVEPGPFYHRPGRGRPVQGGCGEGYSGGQEIHIGGWRHGR